MRIIAGSHKGKKLQCIKSTALRPTMGMVREGLFNICQGEIEGACFLDLFAGVGACGLEAYSRGAKEVIFVERDKKHSALIYANISLLQGEKECRVFTEDVFKGLLYLEKKGFSFDIIFADPPYGDSGHSLSNQVIKAIDKSTLLKKGGRLFLEDHKRASHYEEALTTLQERAPRQIGKATLREFNATLL